MLKEKKQLSITTAANIVFLSKRKQNKKTKQKQKQNKNKNKNKDQLYQFIPKDTTIVPKLSFIHFDKASKISERIIFKRLDVK